MAHLIDLEPTEAVAEARRREDREQAAEQLDRYLRVRLLEFLQNRQGERAELSKALLAARTWAVREVEAYRERWSLLIEVLEGSRRVPSRAEQVELLTDRESSILAQLVLGSKGTSGLRPKDLADRLETSEQNVNNYLRRMEKAGLVARHRMPGQRAVLVFPTRQGIESAERLELGRDANVAAASAEPPVVPSAPVLELWPGRADASVN